MNRAARYNRSMLRFLLAGLVALVASALLACSPSSAPPPLARPSAVPPVAQLTRLVDEYWDESQRLNPHSRSAVVRFEPAAGYDISAQFLADSLDLERRYREALLAVPRDALDAESQLTYDIFKRERDVAIEGYTYPSELMPVNPFRSVPLEFARAGAGVGSYAILSSKDYESWRARAAGYDALDRASDREHARRIASRLCSAAGSGGAPVADARGARRGHTRQRVLSTARRHPVDAADRGAPTHFRGHHRDSQRGDPAGVPAPA